MLWDSVSLLVLFIWCGAALSQVFETRRGAFVFKEEAYLCLQIVQALV